MKTKTPDPIEKRLNRVEGQVKALKKMYQTGKRCEEIVQQVQAARSALSKISLLLLTGEAKNCAQKGDFEKFGKIVDKTFKSS